jgi:hypothetical protein
MILQAGGKFQNGDHFFKVMYYRQFLTQLGQVKNSWERLAIVCRCIFKMAANFKMAVGVFLAILIFKRF